MRVVIAIIKNSNNEIVAERSIEDLKHWIYAAIRVRLSSLGFSREKVISKIDEAFDEVVKEVKHETIKLPALHKE